MSRLRQLLFAPPFAAQGLHVDPLAPDAPPIDESSWCPERRRVFHSDVMTTFRACLPYGNGDERAGVLDDLATYHDLDPEECRQRCLHWEELSVGEWRSADRDSPEGLADFYDRVESWSFDLLWAAYLQSCGYGFPGNVLAADFAVRRGLRGTHLDFGSGVGCTSQLFRRLGFETHLADVSSTLLAFARFRLERRSESATYIDLDTTELEPGRYDVITAIDTLAHVPDVGRTAAQLHRALKPGGWLVTNYDARPPSEESAWHLQHDALRMRYEVQAAGFAPAGQVEGVTRFYRRVDPDSLRHRLRREVDRVVFTNPAAPTLAQVRWPTRTRLRRIRNRILGRSGG